MSVSENILKFIRENFIAGRTDTGLAPEDSLIESGVIDSTGVLELVMFLEETFSITVEDDELVPENLDSIDRIAAFLRRKGVEG